jgi:hypothetical protein
MGGTVAGTIRKDGRAKLPAAPPAGTNVFRVPRDLIRIPHRDLPAAGIPKTAAPSSEALAKEEPVLRSLGEGG